MHTVHSSSVCIPPRFFLFFIFSEQKMPPFKQSHPPHDKYLHLSAAAFCQMKNRRLFLVVEGKSMINSLVKTHQFIAIRLNARQDLSSAFFQCRDIRRPSDLFSSFFSISLTTTSVSPGLGFPILSFIVVYFTFSFLKQTKKNFELMKVVSFMPI